MEIPWLEVSRIVVITQALFIGLYGLLFTITTPVGRVLSVFGFCAVCEVLLRFDGAADGLGAFYPLAIVATSALPAVIWLLTQYIFNDEFRPTLLFWGTIAVYLLLNLVGRLADADNKLTPDAHRLVLYYLPQFIKLGFAIHIIIIAIQGMKADLIEHRRRLRAPVALAAGTIITVTLSSQLLSREFTLSTPPLFEVAYNVIIAYGITLTAFRLRFPILSGLVTEKALHSSEAIKAGYDAIVGKLDAVMRTEKIYLKPGITIGELAEKLDEPEYKLRRVINGSLGYRNFNQYINAFRIRDAEHKLRETDMSIVAIANALGYLSLSSFNKAFKDIKQLTPSEFRKKAGTSPANPEIQG